MDCLTRLLLLALLVVSVFVTHNVSIYGQELPSRSLDDIRATSCATKTYDQRIDLRQAEKVVFTERYGNPIRDFRLRFKVRTAPVIPSADVLIQAYSDPDGDLQWEIKVPAGRKEFWTGEMDASGIKFVISVRHKDSGALLSDSNTFLTADAVIKCGPSTIQQSVFSNQFEPISSADAMTKAAGRSVARLSIVSDDGLPVYCTGFLISQNLIITNRHCVFSGTEAFNTTASFNYDNFLSPLSRINVKEIVASSCDLDFIVLRLVRSPCSTTSCNAASDPKPVSLSKSTTGTPSSRLIVIQHPDGAPKQISRVGCSLLAANLAGNASMITDFGNRCDTSSGSSGSPVFIVHSDGSLGSLIGIHHLGIRADSVLQEIPESERMNRGVYAQQILDFLRTAAPKVFNEVKVF